MCLKKKKKVMVKKRNDEEHQPLKWKSVKFIAIKYLNLNIYS